ncbi:MAG: type I-U CRISPR-associated helicase/endonuclease Cas3 [Acidipropionibacterium acidipropionici]|jgi:CRISPR-associated endonuclease/helicase Cas3|uniref:type I-G CRISPR-associated helicase/endonuclease Cas3g n=1 Tax=Acidipropionibacterium acidipropionici TaxID=1748 RepID=UPI002F35E05A
MTFTVSDFPRFFAAVNGGHRPFPWQMRLIDSIITEGRWPAAITAPTGSGKSAVVETHIFLTALNAVGAAPRLPRRLCVVVDRRALVDSQADRAARVLSWLETSSDALAAEMAGALRSLSLSPDSPPVVLANLRGGIATDRRWIDDPGACAVISATPDMWGSRLLMRGYGTSPAARPREAGLLGVDSVVVIDEAHLSRQLLGTARWVAGHAGEKASAIGVPALQVVESSATARVDEGGTAIGISAEDLADPGLAPRMTRPKPVRFLESPDWSGKKGSKKYVETLAEEANRLYDPQICGTVGCIVNRIDTALRLAEALGDDCPCWVGPMRPMDLTALKADYPGLFGLPDDGTHTTPRFLVATQTVEVGIDVDFVALVTELAPASSLAQRFGRVNRKGARDSGPITVVGPPERAVKDQLPYLQEDLRAGLTWLHDLDGPGGASPESIMACPPPPTLPERPIVKLPHVGDVMRWEATDDAMVADEELELWIRDSLQPDQLQAGLVVRSPLPDDDALAISLLTATPPSEDEVFPVALWKLRSVLTTLSERHGDHDRAFVLRDDEVNDIRLDDDPVDIRAGDVVFVDSGHALTRKGVVVTDASRPEALKTLWGTASTRVIVDGLPGAHWLEDLCGLEDDEAQRAFTDAAENGLITRGPDLIEGVRLSWIVVKGTEEIKDDDSIRQVWTPSEGLVTLEAHQDGVASRAGHLCDTIGITATLRDDLVAAGLHHDDGKADPRFQKYRLNAPDGSEPLAKSPARSAQDVSRRRWSSGLPRGWRHELRSVAVAWPAIEESDDPELVARLIGTSHGRGRVLPQPNASSLINEQRDDDALKNRIMDLFVEGEWCSLMGRTSWRLGAWTCCYLEAVLRAADCRVSKEGS